VSATETALRVVRWSTFPAGALPRGDLHELGALASPAPEVRAFLGKLAATTAARLALDAPPLSDARPAGPAALWLAAAAGAAATPEAGELVRLCPPAQGGWDLVLRHAVVGATLDAVPPLFAESLRAASPLTALLLAPARGEEDDIVALAERLLAQADGRRLLINTLSTPVDDPESLRWRGLLLQSLRLQPRSRPFVLDVYEAAVAVHGRRWLGTIDYAFHALGASHAASEPPAVTGDGARAGERGLQLALAVGEYWAALRALRRTHLSWLQRRPYLHFNVYLQGIKLASTVEKLQGGGN
jgi:hypothetical protein